MKQATKTFTIHVPTEGNLGYTALHSWLKQVAQAGGGYTIHEAMGGYIMETGELIQEPVAVITASAFTHRDAAILRGLFDQLVVDQIEIGGQEAVLVDLGEGPSLFTREDLAQREVAA